MSTPTDGELDAMVNGPFGSRLAELWFRPIRPLIPEVSDAMGKPLAEVTMHEVLSAVVVFGYLFSSMMLAQVMAANLARVAIRGR